MPVATVAVEDHRMPSGVPAVHSGQSAKPSPTERLMACWLPRLGDRGRRHRLADRHRGGDWRQQPMSRRCTAREAGRPRAESVGVAAGALASIYVPERIASRRIVYSPVAGPVGRRRGAERHEMRCGWQTSVFKAHQHRRLKSDDSAALRQRRPRPAATRLSPPRAGVAPRSTGGAGRRHVRLAALPASAGAAGRNRAAAVPYCRAWSAGDGAGRKQPARAAACRGLRRAEGPRWSRGGVQMRTASCRPLYFGPA